MGLNYLSVLVDLFDGQGNALAGGRATFTPSVQTRDAGVGSFTRAPIVVGFRPTGPPTTRLLASDNAAPLPNGWSWNVAISGVPGNPATFNFNLPAGPFAFTATNASPCVFTVTGNTYVNGTAVQLAGGSLPTGFTAGTTYYVVNQSGSTFELAATAGGAPIASTSTGSGTVLTTAVALSGLTPLYPVPAVEAYLPLPTGAAQAGYVPIATGGGEASQWGPSGTGGARRGRRSASC